jgi:hypothetical protein
MISKTYDDTISSAYASKEKLRDLNGKNDNSPIINDDGGIVFTNSDSNTIDVPLTLSNLVSFFQGMYVWYNDGNGTRDVVQFLGADFVDDMQIKCEIKLSNDIVLLVDPETLNFIENQMLHQFHKQWMIICVRATTFRNWSLNLQCLQQVSLHCKKKC